MASVPDSTSRHSASGVSAPPGRRQLIETIAMGSRAASATSSAVRNRARVATSSAVTRLR
jgi:hypothetical protein